jgi:hypothetical protein
MPLTKDQIEQLHPVYRDFMMALKPVIDSRQQPFQIAGIPSGRVYDNSARKYGFDPHQFFEIGRNLSRKGLVELDKFGFYAPTALGEEFIQILAGELPSCADVPPLTLEV